MKVFRIAYTQTTEHVIEMEASSPADAWEKIKTGEIQEEGKDKNVIWITHGRSTFTAHTTQEITISMAANPA